MNKQCAYLIPYFSAAATAATFFCPPPPAAANNANSLQLLAFAVYH